MMMNLAVKKCWSECCLGEAKIRPNIQVLYTILLDTLVSKFCYFQDFQFGFPPNCCNEGWSMLPRDWGDCRGNFDHLNTPSLLGTAGSAGPYFTSCVVLCWFLLKETFVSQIHTFYAEKMTKMHFLSFLRIKKWVYLRNKAFEILF